MRNLGRLTNIKLKLEWNVLMEYLDSVLSKILLGTDVVSTEIIRGEGKK